MVSQPSTYSSVAKDNAAAGAGPANQPALVTAAGPAAVNPLYTQEDVADNSRKRKQQGNEGSGPGKKNKLHQGKTAGKISAGELSDGEMSAADEKAELEKILETWYDKPRGADFPGGRSKIGKMNRARRAILLVRYGRTSWSLDFNVRVKFEMFRQAPSMKIIFGFDDEDADNVVATDVGTFRYNNFAVPAQEDPAAEPLPRFQGTKVRMDLGPEVNQEAAFDEWCKILSERFYCPVAKSMVKRIVDFGASEDGAVSAVHILGFHHQGTFFFDKRSAPVDRTNAEAREKQAKIDEVKELLNSGLAHVTLIRPGAQQFETIDNHWKNNVLRACEGGPYWFYRKYVGEVAGKLFEHWNKSPETSVRRQEWMRKIGTSRSAMEFATHPIQGSYGTAQEMEMAFSLAVLGEMMWESDSIMKYFSYGVKHVARVLDRRGSYVMLALTVEKLEGIQMPLVAVGSSMKVAILPIIKAQAGQNPFAVPATNAYTYPSLPATPASPSTAPPTDAEQPFQTVESKKQKNTQPPLYGWAANQQYKARCIDYEDTHDFVIGFNVEDKDEIKAFNKNQNIDVSIAMTRNSLPSLRQLQAIGRLCSKPETPFEKMMQEFMMGYGQQVISPKTIDELCRPLLSDAEQGALRSYLIRLSTVLDGPQKAAFKAIFKSTKNFMTVIEGIPGGGKTELMANFGVLFAQYGFRTLLTAPSNMAAQQLMVKLSQALDELYKIQPSAKDWFDVIFVPASAATNAELQRFGLEQMATDLVVEGNASSGDKVVDSYRLWTRIVARYNYQATENPAASAEEQVFAKKWLQSHSSLLARRTVAVDDKKNFYNGIGKMATKILSPNGQVRIVVSTCNNAGLLKEYNYVPVASIVDEAASASMMEALIPLTLGSKYNVLGGDDSQLGPKIRSMGHNEFAATFGQTIFARFRNLPAVNTIRLKVNYRMHQEIAHLPGILTYTFMACAGSTNVESDTFTFYKEWYESGRGKLYREARRDPAYGQANNESRIRRLFVNVKNGKSAPKEGGTSKRNFANINAIIDYLISLLNHKSAHSSIPKIDPDNITILVPYKAELTELVKQVKTRLPKAIGKDLNGFPRFRTIDGTQGSENEIILLGLTPADSHNGSILGFLKEWNRVNVALTRAKSVLIIFGNLDCWCSQLKVIGSVQASKNFAYMVVDLLDRGDVIDVDGVNKLPKNGKEVDAGAGSWTMQIEDTPAENSKLSAKGRAIMANYTIPEERDAYERELLGELQTKRDKAGTQEIQMYIKDLMSEDIM
ncbi:tRNA-splicing endonuclease protein [Rutstroemia sp. NJR-2017a WRK4]|nr:tRNA-splicing endonuclease protein [Rutstroemia sp. NJR-2017a WRK4]